MSEKKSKITPIAGGPYLLDGARVLNDGEGKCLCQNDSAALCRCGGSSNKPFCDGTHLDNGFSGKNESDERDNHLDDYRGKKIIIHDNRSLCAHAGVCTTRLPAVFRQGENPWIDPEGANVKEIMATIKDCPSGALSYSLAALETDEIRSASVMATKGGPYYVTGEVELKGCHRPDGASDDHYTLCRCGHSKNKPYCDGTHWTVDFDKG